MTKFTRRTILGFTLIGGLFLLSSRISHAESNPFRLALPAAVLDLTDLDARDAQNRKVASPIAKQKLQTLFTQSLYVSLLNNLTPVKRAMVAALEMSWKASSAWLGKLISRVDQSCRLWFNAKKRKLFSLAAVLGRVDVSLASTHLLLAPDLSTTNSLDILSSTQLRR